MKKRQRITYLEHHIVNEIEDIRKVEGLKQHIVDKLYFVVDSIFESSRREHKNEFSWVPKPRSYWRKTIGGNYNDIINLLESRKIIQDNESWQVGTNGNKGKCINYRINPDIERESELDLVEYYVRNKVKPVDKQFTDELELFYNLFIHDLNDNIFVTKMMEKMKGLPHPTQRMKRRYWMSSYDNLIQGNLYARRNDTNNRLDTNFTNMPKEIRKLVRDLNGLSEIDMVNSQPTILSNMMKMDSEFEMNSDPDVSHYHLLCNTGKLYEFMQDYWKLDDRDDVKPLIYRVMFSNPKYMDWPQEGFDKNFHGVFQYIQDKKLNSNSWKNFAVSLQKLESEIWLDTIKPVLNDNDIIHTTVHDSVIVSDDQLELSTELIQDVMDTNGINGSLRVKQSCDQ